MLYENQFVKSGLQILIMHLMHIKYHITILYPENNFMKPSLLFGDFLYWIEK